jgi:hypothetical protein
VLHGRSSLPRPPCRNLSRPANASRGVTLPPQRCPFNRGNGCPPGIAWRCHRSILQPEANASARDGLVRQLAEATAFDLCAAAARADRCVSSFRTGCSAASRAAAAAAFFAASLPTEEPSSLPRALAAASASRVRWEISRRSFSASRRDGRECVTLASWRIDGLAKIRALRSPPDRTNPRAREPPSGGFSASRPVPAEHCGL